MKWARLAGLVAGVVLSVGCSESASPEPVATAHVELPRSYRFEPQVIEVPAGMAVTWTNSDNFTHTVRLLPDDQGVLGTLEPGQSIEHTFSDPGTYRYDCSLHPDAMDGTVIVLDADKVDDSVSVLLRTARRPR